MTTWCGGAECGGSWGCNNCYNRNNDASWCYEDVETSECQLKKDGYFYNWETNPSGATESECCLNSNSLQNHGFMIVNKNSNEAIKSYGILVEVMDPTTPTDYSSTFNLQVPSDKNQTTFCSTYDDTKRDIYGVTKGLKTKVAKDSMTMTVN